MTETGETVTYKELDDRSNQIAHLFRSMELKRGDVIALMMENRPQILEVAWAAQRSGLYLACISTKLSTEDLSYILRDSGAKLVITSRPLIEKCRNSFAELQAVPTLSVGGATEFSKDWEACCEVFPASPIADESHGSDLLYSSGTTGRPKGIKPFPIAGPIDQTNGLVELGKALYNMDFNTRFYSPAPLYHAAPLRWCMAINKFGGTIYVSDKFDPEAALAIIEKYQITHAQWVPTHFYRLLQLPESVRNKYDHSSLVTVFHAAAPCPPKIKRAMIEWWGPIVHEFYSGTECPGITTISTEEWLEKEGSVGRAILGKVRICDEDGNELPAGEIGSVYFSDGPQFEYLNDPEKTRKCHNRHGWATLGDMGYLDEDGFLFLADRKDFMVISGGVNIYPQEIENCLLTNPAVADAAVFGIPDEEMGERVVAIIVGSDQAPDNSTDVALGQELEKYCLAKIGRIKTPRQFIFRNSVPRMETGKIQKKLLREMLINGTL